MSLAAGARLGSPEVSGGIKSGYIHPVRSRADPHPGPPALRHAAILKGWIERVFTLGFAFDLRPDARKGDIHGRVPLLSHEKALIIQTTFFDEAAYNRGLSDAMKRLMDDFGLRYPGVKKVEHVYFHAVHGVDDVTRCGYLEPAYALGREF